MPEPDAIEPLDLYLALLRIEEMEAEVARLTEDRRVLTAQLNAYRVEARQRQQAGEQ